jgi:hypothetical protein
MTDLMRKAVDQFQDWINLVLAVVLFVSPWAFGFAGETGAAWNAWICGIVIAVLAVLALVKFAEWEEWIAAALGVWLIISPWVLGFAAMATALWTHIVLGVVIAALAVWRGWQVHQGQKKATA